ncbi:MAG: hypothetical protein JW769_04065 [Parachlamydiales bacterium]|nr:hypothetical protein [Parachlamydiales bacterium]
MSIAEICGYRTMAEVPKSCCDLASVLKQQPVVRKRFKKLDLGEDRHSMKIFDIISQNAQRIFESAWPINGCGFRGSQIRLFFMIQGRNESSFCSSEQLLKIYQQVCLHLRNGWYRETEEVAQKNQRMFPGKNLHDCTLLLKKKCLEDERDLIRLLAHKFELIEHIRCYSLELFPGECFLFLWVKSSEFSKVVSQLQLEILDINSSSC